ncbi:hypothetical protein NDQ71_16250 [Pseudoalteromonas sp. KG3]|uniref:hypothetical protein n=1 Tax=Pseudoalteromonas sp. KG3 TaxID=2951137 RepID=UPI0026586A6A|nr:hypothetical protein [Pseudoalteromonas sp. KG3]WKD23158.1 hypothetical protein NDQ71_16250 [Pseudoalteromonas sp. KG3]
MNPKTGTYADAVRRTAIAGAVGGTVSKLTGGKFANGAITSAMQWWYNAEGNPSMESRRTLGITKEEREFARLGNRNESPRVHRRPVCLSQATLPDSFKLS